MFFPGVPANSSQCSGEKSIINLERVLICEDEVRGALLSVQDFVENSHFTRRNFFSDSGIVMLPESAANSDSITKIAVFEPWSHVETAFCPHIVALVFACVNQAVDRRRAVKDSQEQLYAVDGIRPSSEDSASPSGVRISNVAEEGRVENVPVGVPSINNSGPSNLRVYSGVSNKGKVSRSPVKIPRRFEISSPAPSSQQHRVVADLDFSAALDRQQSCRKSWRRG